MTTQELHIQLDILLQKVSSNWNKNFLPQELDFFINREIFKFIRQRINPLSNNKKQSGFDIIQRVENLNSLINTVSPNINNINQKEANIQLPFDFLSYISTEVDTYLVCPEDNLQTNTITKYYQTFPPINNITDFIQAELSITYNLTNVSPTVVMLCHTNNFPAGYLPQDDIEDYKKVFIYNNGILNISLSNLPNGFELKFDNNTQLFEISGNQPFSTFFPITYTSGTNNTPITTINKILNIYDLKTDLISKIRIIDEEFKRNIKNSNLSSSKDDNLVGILRDNEILITKSKNAVNTIANLTYYKKPRKIDLLLGINSDLPNEVLDEIISNTAQTLKAVISSDTYDKYVQENLLIE